LVQTGRGRIRARVVVLATEGYTARLPGRHLDIVPLYSLMIATEPLGADRLASLGSAVRAGATFTDARHLIIYGQATEDGRLAFGGRGAPYHFGSEIKASFDRKEAVHKALAASLGELFPQLGRVRVTHEWGGPLGVHRDWFPSVSFDRAAGVATAGGYVGDGVSTTNLAGRTLADLILDRESGLTSLAWVGHSSRHWEPEPLRWLGVNAGLAVMTLADRTEARTGRPSRLAASFNRLTGG
ncbi:MAG: NAD(P)/FAD-dependent oxidoreductase, partial [Acidimicrobiales bacterium]